MTGPVTTTTRLVFPDQTNHHGTFFGGEALSMMASTAAIAATRRARHPVVLVNSDSIDFVAPVPLGSIVETRSAVESVGRTSLVVGTTLEAEDLLTGSRVRACNGRFVFVAVDEAGTPTPVPPVENDATEVAHGSETTETTELVMPGISNPHGVLFGGELLRLLDAIAFIAASRQMRIPLVTARSEQTDFHSEVAVGELIQIRGGLTEARTRSLVIDVDATAENPLTGTTRPCTHARFVFAPTRAK